MSGTTSVPAPSLTAAGFVAPAETDILTGRQADINAAFGGALNSDETTPQGQLAVTDTAIIGDANDAFLSLANGVDPAYASGRMQDAIGRFYFMTRKPAQSTSVVAQVVTTAAVTLAAGTSIAQDTQGYLYAPVSAVTISAAGTTSVTLACTTTGPIPCAAGALSLYRNVSGVSAVSNAAEGVLGSAVEGRAAFEARRASTTAGNSSGSNAAVLGSILAVSGVTDAYVIDNPTAEAVTTSGVTIAARSIYCCVAGGAAADIATAIIKKKAPGCGYAGGTTVTVPDPSTLYSTPPQYAVSFDVAVATPIYIAVTLKNSTAVPSTALASIQAAIIAAFAGTDTVARARIGDELFASSYYAAVAAVGSWAQIVEITIGTAASPTGFTTQLNINQVPTIAAGNITLTLQ